MPLQHGLVAEHCWPYCAHGGGLVPPSVVGVGADPHVPCVDPVGTLHGRPEQQSALTVHAPPDGTQAPSHLRLTHGFPQQSALVAHA